MVQLCTWTILVKILQLSSKIELNIFLVLKMLLKTKYTLLHSTSTQYMLKEEVDFLWMMILIKEEFYDSTIINNTNSMFSLP